MPCFQGLLEKRPIRGDSLCGEEDVEITSNIQIVDCRRCRKLYRDLRDRLSIDIGIEIGISNNVGADL